MGKNGGCEMHHNPQPLLLEKRLKGINPLLQLLVWLSSFLQLVRRGESLD